MHVFIEKLRLVCLKWNSTFTAAIITGTVWNSINNFSTAGHLTLLEPSDGNWNVTDSDKLESVFKISVIECALFECYSHTGLAYLQGDTDFWHRLGLEKETTALYLIPTPEEKLNEQTPELCTSKITAHCWHGGPTGKLRLSARHNKVDMNTGSLQSSENWEACHWSLCSCETAALMDDSGLGPWRAPMCPPSPVVACGTEALQCWGCYGWGYSQDGPLWKPQLGQL